MSSSKVGARGLKSSMAMATREHVGGGQSRVASCGRAATTRREGAKYHWARFQVARRIEIMILILVEQRVHTQRARCELAKTKDSICPSLRLSLCREADLSQVAPPTNEGIHKQLASMRLLRAKGDLSH